MDKVIYDHEIESLCFKLSILGKDRIAIQKKALGDKAVVKSILESMLKQRSKPGEKRITQFNRLYKAQSRQARQKANTDAFIASSEEAERIRNEEREKGFDPTNTKQLAALVEQYCLDNNVLTEDYEKAMDLLGIEINDEELADVPF